MVLHVFTAILIAIAVPLSIYSAIISAQKHRTEKKIAIERKIIADLKNSGGKLKATKDNP